MIDKYLVPAFGVAAFVVGGLLMQKKAVEMIQELRAPFPSKES